MRRRHASNEIIRMTENGTATFASPDEYSAAIGAAKVNLFVTAGGEFKGRLTWLNLGGLHVLRGRENLPRIGFVALPSAQACISFPASGLSGLIYCGLSLNLGDVVFHGLGERAHQRTVGEGDWCFMSLAPEQLAACSKALTSQSIRPPPEARVIVPQFRQSIAEPAFKGVPARRNQTGPDCQPRGCAISRAGVASCARQLPGYRECRQDLEVGAASYRHHGTRRGGPGDTKRAAFESV